MIKAALYPRVSTAKQQEGYSIGEQIERLTKYCEAMGWTVYHIYTDAGYSGGNMDRPGLQAMLRDVEAGKIDKVVVYKLDRLSRSQLDTLYLIEKVFLPNGVDFVSMSENFDTGTTLGRAIIGILATFAQLEKDQIRERMTMGREARIKEGYWIGTVAPMGYVYENKQLKINEYEAMQVREMFDLFLRGTPLRDIETQFSEKGYTLRGRPWRLYSIRYMLDNKVYAGYIRKGDEWVKGVHDPIVSEETCEAARKKMEANRVRFADYGVSVNGDRHSTLLGGLVYCKWCGARYGKRLGGSPPNRHYDYVCYSRMKVARQMVKDPDCKNRIYRVSVLDSLILGEVGKLATDKASLEKVASQKPKKEDPEKKRGLILKHIEKIDTQISRFMDLYGTGRYSIDQLDAKVEPLEEEREKLQDQLRGLGVAPVGVTRAEAETVLTTFNAAMQRADLHELRRILETLIDRIDIDGDNIDISWRFA